MKRKQHLGRSWDIIGALVTYTWGAPRKIWRARACGALALGQSDQCRLANNIQEEQTWADGGWIGSMGCLNTTYKYQSHSPFKLYQLQLKFLGNWKKLSMKHTARCIIIKICNQQNSSSNPYPISIHPIHALSTLCRIHRHFPLKEKRVS